MYYIAPHKLSINVQSLTKATHKNAFFIVKEPNITVMYLCVITNYHYHYYYYDYEERKQMRIFILLLSI